MDFRFTDEHRMWRDTLDRFMENEVGREYTREKEAAREFPEEAYRKVAEQGWLGLLVPEELGGLELDPVMYAIFVEAISKFSLDFTACFITSMFTLQNIATNGTEEQKEKYVPGFLAGDLRFSVSISEPGAGSDAASVRTKAVRDGDEWVINGNKIWCSGAHHPNTTIVLLARTGEDRYGGLTTILLPNDTKGIDMKKMPTMVRKSLGTTEYFLTDVRVPVTNTLGKEGEGWKIIGSHLQLERMSSCGLLCGQCPHRVG